MTTVHDLLRIKGGEVWGVSSHTTILQALKKMAEKDVGALLVVDDDQIVGIISERDFVRSVAQTETCHINATVEAYMTRAVVTVRPEQTIEACMQLMTEHRIRHLPVVENQQLVGLISIGDVVKEMISGRESTITSLEDFIEGRGYGH